MRTEPHESLEFAVEGTGETIKLSDFTAVVAGYTGRDIADVQRHIDELAEIGVAPPPEIPMFYPMPSDLFTTEHKHAAANNSLHSGEVEPAYIRHAGKYYLGIGSDHTDRDLEAVDIGESKQACPKPVSAKVIPVEDFSQFALDDCIARSWVDGVLYQEGALSGLRPAKEIIDLLINRSNLGAADFVCLGGTLPLIDKKFTAGAEWRVRIDLPDGRFLEHTYTFADA